MKSLDLYSEALVLKSTIQVEKAQKYRNLHNDQVTKLSVSTSLMTLESLEENSKCWKF